MGEEVRNIIGKAAKSMVVAPRRCRLLVWSLRIGKGLSPAQLLAADDFRGSPSRRHGIALHIEVLRISKA